MQPKTLDHVALWVSDRDAIAQYAEQHLGMHVIDRNEKFTLIGADARRGKLTLFEVDGPRERGALKHIALRISSRHGNTEAEHELAPGVEVRLVQAPTDSEYDLDHVALYSRNPDATAREYERYGFNAAAPGPSGAPRVEVGGAFVEFHHGDPEEASEAPLLHHLAVLVDSAEAHIAEAQESGIEVADVVDAANTQAVFLWGPDRVKIEYVEHKPTFSLV